MLHHIRTCVTGELKINGIHTKTIFTCVAGEFKTKKRYLNTTSSRNRLIIDFIHILNKLIIDFIHFLHVSTIKTKI
jgi:hypothetical protein